MAKNRKLDPKLQAWVDARKRYKLSHAQIQMARELGMSPKSLGKLANPQQRWKAPLPIFIEDLYSKRFGRERPDELISIENLWKKRQEKKAERRELKRLRREEK